MTLTHKLIRLDSIDVPEEYERKSSLVEDDALRQSAEQGEVQQGVGVLEKPDGRYEIVDGTRRVLVAQAKGEHTIPAVVHTLPSGADPALYRNRLRLILNNLRQDLRPSQRASFIRQCMQKYALEQKDVAAMLGVDAGSVSGWLSIENYAPEIVRLIDAGQLTLFAARSFDGIRPEFQMRVYKAMRKEFDTLPGGKLHKTVRAKFSPKSHPDYYLNPARTLEKLSRQKAGRKARKRKPLTRSEKDILSRDLGLREVELEEGAKELEQLKREIRLAAIPIRAIMRNEDLKARLDPATREEFGVFLQSY